MSILDLDATTIAQKIRNRELSSLAVTEQYIHHLEQVNPALNCLVEERFDAARMEARQCDEMLAAGNAHGRLFGVPISLKEAFDMVGTKTTGGLLSRRNHKATEDADVVARLKREGAIIVGKTNTPTLCFCQETDNKLYGRTNNPWDLNRTAGGSSGGEGALIAAGGAAVGVGADIGGSIRFPAHFNGVIGFKSGAEQISDRGAYPPFTHPLQSRMFGVGAMAKSVADTRLMNDILAVSLPPKQSLTDFELVIPIQALKDPTSESTIQIISEIKDELNQHYPIKDELPPMYDQAAVLWQLIMSIDGAASVKKEAFQGEGKPSVVAEWIKERLFRNSKWHAFLTWALIGATTFKPSPDKLKEVTEQVHHGDDIVQAYLKNNLVILPVYHSPARRHGEVYKEIFSIRKTYQRYMPYVAYANLWGLPSLTLPVGDEQGLPIAIQIISNIGNEDAIFKLGEQLESRFRGWKRAML